MDEYFTVARAAAVLGVSTEGLRKRLQRGVMRGEHLTATMWVIPRVDVERMQQMGKLRRGRKPKGQQSVEEREKESE